MPIAIEQYPGEAIIYAVVNEPFVPDEDLPEFFGKFIPLRVGIQGAVVLIVDFSAAADSFSRVVMALARAAQGIRASKTAGVGGPPILIFVGSGTMAEIASQSMGQAQYGGGASAELCATREEALALARSKLSS